VSSSMLKATCSHLSAKVWSPVFHHSMQTLIEAGECLETLRRLQTLQAERDRSTSICITSTRPCGDERHFSRQHQLDRHGAGMPFMDARLCTSSVLALNESH